MNQSVNGFILITGLNLKNAKPCKVAVLVVPCANGKRNIELQCNMTESGYVFEELFFGSYSYEMFDTPEEMVKDYLIERIREIMRDQIVCITKYNLKRKLRLFDGLFDKNDTDDMLFGEKGHQRAIRKMEKKKNLIQRILNTQVQYEIYDFHTYRCITK